ncbi:ribosome-associated translation inhibitor RaiA [bacterium]|nr:ribosome-associated translation inhibitor RaiA [bacterium]
MELVIKGHHVEVTDALRDYADKKVGRVVRNVDGVIETQVELSVNKNPSVPDNQIVEVTLFAKGTVIRAEVSTESMYASLDLVADKLERQIRRYRQKLNGHDRHHRQKTATAVAAEPMVEATEEVEREIVRSKSFPVLPMSPDDAAVQMELLGHNFFMFINQFTSQVNVIYHRKDGNYGLIEPTA